MLKKIIVVAITGLVVLGPVTGVKARPAQPQGTDTALRRAPDSAMGTLISAASAEKGTEGEEEKDLQEQLKALTEELKKLEEEIKEKVHKELVPHLKREIEKFRKWLKEFQLDEKDQEPVKT